MPLSLVAQIWLLCVVLGVIFLSFRATRKFAYFLIFVSTGTGIVPFF
jgi:hypothetical protein